MTIKNILKNRKKQAKIAIIGHRGIPNSYGGFETLAEELSSRLVKKGMKVVVYCRSNYFVNQPKKYKGANLIYLPTITNKILDTPIHSFLTVLHVLFFNTADIILAVNVGNAPFLLLPKLLGKKIIFNVDGLDWQRKKWGKIASAYLYFCSYLAPYVANKIITDAASVKDFYKTERKVDSVLIPYGTDIIKQEQGSGILKKLNLKYKDYFLFVARFEPEYNPLLVVKAYKKSGSKLPLVMIGDNRYNPKYVAKIKKEAKGSKVIFLGYVFGSKYKTLLNGALVYIRAAEVGGASPAVIEAMGRGLCILANNKPENREMLDKYGIYFKLNMKSLAKKIKKVSYNKEKILTLGRQIQSRAKAIYSWESITNSYFQLVSEAMPKYSFNQKRVLITGAGGMLGQAMYEYFSKKYIVKATDIDLNENWLSYLDVRDYKQYEKIVKAFKPNYIFHLAALTSLEECEENPLNAYNTNTLSVKHVAKLSKEYNAKLVYISSAGIFDGREKYYNDDDESNPINIYGVTKHFGEIMTKNFSNNYIIIRPGWMIGGGQQKDKKFVSYIIKQLTAGNMDIYAVDDKYGTPTYTHDVARNLDLLLKDDIKGKIYNMVCSGIVNRYDIAKEIVKSLGYANIVQVHPVKSRYFENEFPVARPVSENLINKRLILENRNLMRHWKVALKDYLKRDYSYAMAEEKEVLLPTVQAKIA